MSAAGAIRAGAAYVEVFMEQNALSRSLAATGAKLRSWSAGLSRLGAATRGGELPGPLAAIANFSFSPAGLVTGMLEAVREWAKGGAELAHLSEQAGTTVEEFSALGYAARRCGVDTAGLSTGLRKMQVTVAAAARGMPQASDALAMIGANLQELARMRPEDQFKYMADRIAAIQNPTERAAAAVRIFGRAGTEMLPMLMQGSAGIDRFEQRARELGLVTSTESAQAALRFSRSLADLTDVLKKCVSVIGSALGPYIEELTNWIVTVAVKVRQWISDHRGLVLVLFKVAGALVLAGAGFSLFGRIIGMLAGGIGGVVSAISMVGTVVSTAGTLIAGAWSGITAVIGIVGSALAALLSPIGLVVAAVVAGTAAFLYFSGIGGKVVEYLKGTFAGLASDMMAAFGAVGDALAAGDIALAAKVLWSLLKMEWQKGVNFLTEVWIGVKETFMSTWTETVYGIAKIGTRAWGMLQSGWNALCTGLSSAWAIFCDWVKTAWNAASNWVKSTWTTMKEKVGAISPEEANQARAKLAADYDQTKRQQTADREQKLAAIGGQFEARQREIDQSTQGALGELDREKERKHAERQAAYAKQLADSQADVDNAKKEFDAARAEAAAKRAAMGKDQGGPGEPGKFAPMDLDAMPGAKASVVGTFNAAAVSGLGLGGGVFQEMKHQLNRIGDNGDKLLQEVQHGGVWE
jgi:hypothetical protein